MIRQELKEFVDTALDAACLSEADISRLREDILGGAPARRAEVDALVVLDRIVTSRPDSWDDAFVDLVVSFVAARAETTGVVERDVVNWLMTTLDASGAITENGLRIAIEVSRAGNHVDQTLLTFVLQTLQARRPGTTRSAGPQAATEAATEAATDAATPTRIDARCAA